MARCRRGACHPRLPTTPCQDGASAGCRRIPRRRPTTRRRGPRCPSRRAPGIHSPRRPAATASGRARPSTPLPMGRGPHGAGCLTSSSLGPRVLGRLHSRPRRATWSRAWRPCQEPTSTARPTPGFAPHRQTRWRGCARPCLLEPFGLGSAGPSSHSPAGRCRARRRHARRTGCGGSSTWPTSPSCWSGCSSSRSLAPAWSARSRLGRAMARPR
mmetsp:Transcript_47147/g.137101  ORF Transcript_47147/g.137101 Transcript_47147/m.137101 type:complete len:214 (+) Transcript_47147:1265-1906(+)